MGVMDRLLGTSRAHTLAAYGSDAQNGLLSPAPWADDSVLEDISLPDLFFLQGSIATSRSNAMKIATVARIRNVIAGTIGRLPLYDEKAGQRNPVGRSLLSLPDPARPRVQTLTWTVDQLIFYPCTWWQVTRRDQTTGYPADVRLVMHDQAELDSEGNLIKVDGRAVDPRDIIRFDAPNAGLLVDGDRTLRRAAVIEMAAAKAEDNPVPTFELHNEGDLQVPDGMTRQQAVDQFLSDWEDGRRKHSTGYTSKGISTIAHGIAPEQLLIDGRKRIDLEICRHMNAQAWVADVAVDGSSLTYANLTDRNRDFVNTTLATYMTAITDRLSMGDVTPAGWTVRFDTDDLTRDDQATRYANYEIALRNKWITLEEIRSLEGLPQLPAAAQPTAQPTAPSSEAQQNGDTP